MRLAIGTRKIPAAIDPATLVRAQFSALLREKQLLFQLSKNFRDLEGSWRGYSRRLRLIMQGEPGKKE